MTHSLKSTYFALLVFLCFSVPCNSYFENIINILHTSDVRMHFEEHGASHQACGYGARCYGGIARFQKYRFDQLRTRSRRKDVYVVDAGGLIDGRIMEHPQGEALVKGVVKPLGHNVMTLGAPEISAGLENVASYLKAMFDLESAMRREHGFVCTNIKFSTESRSGKLARAYCRKSIIKSGNTKIPIAFLGYVQPDMVRKTDPNITILDVVTSLNDEISRLQNHWQKPKAFIVLAYTNNPLGEDILEKVPGINVLVSGHSNAMFYNGIPPIGPASDFRYPEEVETYNGQVLVVGTYPHLTFVGNLQLGFDSYKSFVSHGPSNAAFLSPDMRFNNWWNEAMLRSVGHKREVLLGMMGGHIGLSPFMLDGSMGCGRAECSVGNLIADVMVDLVAQNSDLQRPDERSWSVTGTALLESAVIGLTMPAGDITTMDIDNSIGSDTAVELVLVTGSELENLLADMVKSAVESIRSGYVSNRFPHISGLRIYRHPRLEKVEILCNKCLIPSFVPLNHDGVYNIVMTTSLADWQVKSGFLTTPLKNRRVLLHDSLRNATAEYLRRTSPITVVSGDRYIYKSAGAINCPMYFVKIFLMKLMLSMSAV